MSPLERPSSISDLAPELIAHILSILLEESRPTLLDCALVCRYWLATTRVLLFTEVNLKNHRDMRYFASLISTSPMIKSCIKVIRIDKRRFAAWTSTSVTEAFCDLFTVPGLLPNLRKLYLGNVYETWTMAAFEKLSRLSTVTSLIVDKCSMSKAELLMLLASFGSLQECLVRHLDISRYQTDIPLPVLACRPPTSLRSFELSHRPAECRWHVPALDCPHEVVQEIINWLTKVDSTSGRPLVSLHTLTVQINVSDFYWFTEFLQRWKHTLQRLNIICAHGGVYHPDQWNRTSDLKAAVVKAFDIKRFTKIKHIYLDLPPISVVKALLVSYANSPAARSSPKLSLYIHCNPGDASEDRFSEGLSQTLQDARIRATLQPILLDPSEYKFREFEVGSDVTTCSRRFIEFSPVRDVLRLDESALSTHAPN